MVGSRPLVALVACAVLLAGCTAPGGSGEPRAGPGFGGESGTSPAGPDATPTAGPSATSTPANASPTRNATPTPAAADVPPPEVTVRLNCTTLRVTVTPAVWHYRLYLRYLDTVTGKQRRIAAGFFTGTVTDHFGPTDFALVAVEVRVTGFGPVLRTRPTRCKE